MSCIFPGYVKSEMWDLQRQERNRSDGLGRQFGEATNRISAIGGAEQGSSSMEAEQGANPVQDQNTPSASGSANMETMEME